MRLFEILLPGDLLHLNTANAPSSRLLVSVLVGSTRSRLSICRHPCPAHPRCKSCRLHIRDVSRSGLRTSCQMWCLPSYSLGSCANEPVPYRLLCRRGPSLIVIWVVFEGIVETRTFTQGGRGQMELLQTMDWLARACEERCS